MRSTMWRSASSLALLILVTAGTAAAQTTYPNVKLAGRLQVEYYGFNTGENTLGARLTTPESSFMIRRARIEAKGNLTENITFVIQPNYTTGGFGGAVSFKDAYLDVAFTKPEAKSAVVLRAGQFKRFFGRYELTSSNNLPSIERGAYRGLLPVSSNDLAIANGYEAHDIGAGLMYTGLDKRLAVMGSIMNGALNTNNLDVNSAKSFYARATYAITPMLSIGASWSDHDFIAVDTAAVPDDTTLTRNAGYGFDAQWSAPGNEGLYVMVDYLSGESTLNSANRIWGIQGVAAYNIRMQSPTSFLYAIEPAFRYDIAEPNNSVIDDQTTLITAGVNLYLSSKAQFRLMYESQSFEDSSLKTISGFRTALTMNF